MLMATDPIASAWYKYKWANEHMDAVAKAIREAVDPNVHPIAVDVKLEPAHGNIAVVRVTKLPNIRTDYGLTLGDMIQNFRSALDHLAWGLVQIGSNPRPKKPRLVQFPMASSGKAFRDGVGTRLPGVPKEYRTIVRRYQPYRRGDRAKAIRWLGKLSNMDKHRILIPAIVSLGDIHLRVTTNWPVQGVDQLVKGPLALNVGTPLMRVPLVPVLGTDCQVKVDGKIACFPSLGYGLRIDQMLPLIRDTVFEILDTSDKRL